MKKVSAENMTVICNIQMMWSAMGILHDHRNFDDMCELNYDELQVKQAKLLVEYNKYIKEKPKKEESRVRGLPFVEGIRCPQCKKEAHIWGGKDNTMVAKTETLFTGDYAQFDHEPGGVWIEIHKCKGCGTLFAYTNGC